jgi:hypothetical protein
MVPRATWPIQGKLAYTYDSELSFNFNLRFRV